MKQTLDAKFLMAARLGVKEEPVIIADVVGKDCDLKIGASKIPYSNLNFIGRILSLHQNRKRGDLRIDWVKDIRKRGLEREE